MRWAVVAVILAELVGPAFAQCETPPPGEPLTLSRPVAGSIVREFGNFWSDVMQKKTFNSGIDLEAQPGEPVYAAAGGTVVSAEQGAAGLAVIIDHGNGLQTLYMGLSSASLPPGACVKGGEQIGLALTDPKSAGVVHFELRRKAEPVDPRQYLQ